MFDPEADQVTLTDGLLPPPMPKYAAPLTELEVTQQKVKLLIEAMQSMVTEFLRYGSRPWAVDLIRKTLKECEELDETPTQPVPNTDLEYLVEYWKKKYYEASIQARDHSISDKRASQEHQLEDITAQRDVLLAFLTEMRTLQSVFEAKWGQIQDLSRPKSVSEAYTLREKDLEKIGLWR
jgi:hypothetical protein